MDELVEHREQSVNTDISFCRLCSKQRDHLKEMRRDGSIIAHWNIKKFDRTLRNGLIWYSIRKMTGVLNRLMRRNVQYKLKKFLISSGIKFLRNPCQ